jgi:transcriptional regulator with XRE-family HTH domain
MTPADLTAARKSLGLSQGQLAERLGYKRLAVARWETGVHPVPQVVAIAVRCMMEHG